MVMRQRRLEWFGHVKRRGETENIRPRGRPKLRWNDTVRRDLKAWNIKEEWATDRERPATANRETAAKGEKDIFQMRGTKTVKRIGRPIPSV